MNKKISSIALTLICAAMLTGCLEPEVESTTTESAQALVNSLTYVKSRQGICFGVGTVSRVSSNGSLAMNNLVVAVDCKAAGLSK